MYRRLDKNVCPATSDQWTRILTNKDFPEITRRHSNEIVVTFPSWAIWSQQPVIWICYISHMVVQSILIYSIPPPFADVMARTIISPLAANCCQSGVVILHSNKRATGVGLDIRLTVEVLDYSFTSSASDHGYVECTSVFFTAVESQLINFISEPVACIAVITLDGFACLSKVTEWTSRLRSILEIKLLYTNEM